jgi:hypothetical protein
VIRNAVATKNSSQGRHGSRDDRQGDGDGQQHHGGDVEDGCRDPDRSVLSGDGGPGFPRDPESTSSSQCGCREHQRQVSREEERAGRIEDMRVRQEREHEGLDMRGRREEAFRSDGPVLKRPPQPHLPLHGAVGQEDQHRGQEQQGAREPEIAHAPEGRKVLAAERAEHHQARHGHREEHRAMAAREGLQREERRRQPQVPPASRVQIRVQRRQGERHPLDRTQVQLAGPEEARRREREDDPGEKGAGRPDAHPPCQNERAEAAERAGQQGHDVQPEHRVAGEPLDRREHQRAADQVLGVSQGVAKGMVDVRVEYREGLADEGVRVPRQRPDEQVSVRAHGERRGGGADAERPGQQQRQRGVDQRGVPGTHHVLL